MFDENRLLCYGGALNRVALGTVLLAHSVYLKFFVFTLPGTAAFFASLGLPPTSAYAVFGIEALAGAALIVGYRVRLAALAVLPVLLGATWAHAGNGWLFTNSGGGWEYPLFLAVNAGVQALVGSVRVPKIASAPVGTESRLMGAAS
jgi:putative oxidoreductase